MDDLDLDRELHRALRVTPSPEFVARVRTRIAEAPPPSTWAGVLRPAAAVTCAAAAAIAVGIWQGDARLKPSPTEAVPMVEVKVGDTHSDETAPTTTTRPVGAPGVAPSRAARDDGRAITSSTPPASANAITASPTATQPPMPEVIIAPDDIKALHEFVTGARELRFVASFDVTPAPIPWTVPETLDNHN